MIQLQSKEKIKRQGNFVTCKSGNEHSQELENIFSSNVQIEDIYKFSNTKQEQFKIKAQLQGDAAQGQNIKNKVEQTQAESLQNKSKANTKQKHSSIEPICELQNIRKMNKVQKQVENKQYYDTDNRKQNQQKKTSIKDYSNKQNYQQTVRYAKRTKSIKKVAFQQLSNESHKEDIKSLKIFTETSIKIDELHSEVSSSHYQMKNSSKSFKMISENGTYRMTKIVGSNQDVLKLMIKQVQLKTQQIQIKQQQLFRVSSEIKHPNILRMFSKSKIHRQNKTYLQIKMQFYQSNLVNYLTMNQYSPSLAIQRKIILFQITKGLNFIHQKKIYHRDLNPFNIMVGDKLKVAITNFAYIQNQPHKYFSKNNFYQCNSFIRPPEIILNPLRSFDRGGDIWALGCIIVFMLKGDMPFRDYSDADMIIQMIKFLGKPSTQYLQSIGFKGNRRFIFPDLPILSMKRFFNCEDDSLLEMLQSIFKYDPQLRQTSENLLKSQYFDELRDQTTFQNLCRNYEIENLFDFSNQLLEKNKKKLIVPNWYKLP